MTNTFRRHHKTIMWIIIVGTILSFVYYLTPMARNGGIGSGGSEVSYGTVNGEPVTQQQFRSALRGAKMIYRFRIGRWPTPDDQAHGLIDWVYQRILIEAKIKEMHIDVTTEAKVRYTKQMFGIPQDQAFPKDKFADWVQKELIAKGGVGADDFDTFIHDQVGEQILLAMFGMNGELITPQEGEFFFKRDHETMAVQMVSFPATNYTAGINPTPQELGDFYTNRQADYRLPEREQVDYIWFNITNYQDIANKMYAGISNVEANIDQAYISVDPSSYKDEAGNQLTPDAAKAKLREEYHRELALKASQTNAFDIMAKLMEGHDKDHPITKGDVEKCAATNGLKAVTTEPFDEQNPPKNWQFPPVVLNNIFELDSGDPNDQVKVLPATNGYYIVALDARLPSQGQPLETVRAKVTEDYRLEKALALARDAGVKFDAAVRLGLSKGQSFDDICAAQRVKPRSLTPFSLVTPSIPDFTDRNEYDAVVGTAYEVPVGQSSPFRATIDGGFLVYVKNRTPVDDTIVNRDLPTFLEHLRQEREQAAYAQWLQNEFIAHVKKPDQLPPLS